MKTGVKLAITLFTLVAIAHGLRLLFSIPVTAGNWSVPQWISLFGLLVPALVAWLLWRENSP
ncbi:MAG: hypothetical protein KJO85_00945 [Gammaproteobacteria bacterium]|nr:hypothetical protein [Gammaproteobacteria bacterium]NNE05150.1 hypothetical protein [Xanthomonadales bacterium]